MAKKMMKFAKAERLAIIAELDGEPETAKNIQAAQKRIEDRKGKKSGMALVKGKKEKKAKKKPAPAKFLRQREVINLLNATYAECNGKNQQAKVESYNIQLSFLLASTLSYQKFNKFIEKLQHASKSDK